MYFIYLLVTIPIDFNRILKCFLMAQYNLLKYRVSNETRHAAFNINSFINSKISSIGFLHSGYNKIIEYVYKMATQQPNWFNMIIIMIIQYKLIIIWIEINWKNNYKTLKLDKDLC